jgi:hypothetical protein
MGGLMKNKLILIFIAILIMASVYCLAEEPDSAQENVKTGDIMVVARGCGLPPYEFGLKLTLNKIPRLHSINIPEWIESIPNDERDRAKWRNKILDSMGLQGYEVLQYIYDSLDINLRADNRAQVFRDRSMAVGITDSLGRYIFIGISPGKYQVVVERNYGHSDEKQISDSLYAGCTDFPELPPYPPEYIKYLKSHLIEDYNDLPSGVLISSLLECDPGITDYVEVLPDSISVVKTAIDIHDNLDPHIGRVKVWNKEFKPRDGHNEKRNKH